MSLHINADTEYWWHRPTRQWQSSAVEWRWHPMLTLLLTIRVRLTACTVRVRCSSPRLTPTLLLCRDELRVSSKSSSRRPRHWPVLAAAAATAESYSAIQTSCCSSSRCLNTRIFWMRTRPSMSSPAISAFPNKRRRPNGDQRIGVN